MKKLIALISLVLMFSIVSCTKNESIFFENNKKITCHYHTTTSANFDAKSKWSAVIFEIYGECDDQIVRVFVNGITNHDRNKFSKYLQIYKNGKIEIMEIIKNTKGK